VLAALDDRDLRVERQRLVSQGVQQENERRQAIAEGNRARARILEAQNGQVDAQLALVDEQIARTRLVAPFDAVIVKGDLSQSLGAAVERGNVLFELAPLDTYRVIMKVDERDITEVAVGQSGRLALTSMPNDEIGLSVEKITPVSVVEEGRNYFRVEAVAKGATEKLRPGMEGVGKIQVDRRKLLWIWTHKLVHWMRMWVWSWWP
jgi:multidrug resistance efflux pump